MSSFAPAGFCCVSPGWTMSRASPATSTTSTSPAICRASLTLIARRTRTHGTVIGYWLGEPFWNRGFMTEAVGAIVDWYFEATRAVTLGSGVFSFNRASLAVQRKLGFTETGSSYRLCLARKQEVRHIDTELTRARWAKTVARRLRTAS